MSGRSRRERFVTLAENRVDRAIKSIRLIGNLAHRGNYEYGEEDVQKITTALQKELKSLKMRFSKESDSSGPLFKL